MTQQQVSEVFQSGLDKNSRFVAGAAGLCIGVAAGAGIAILLTSGARQASLGVFGMLLDHWYWIGAGNGHSA